MCVEVIVCYIIVVFFETQCRSSNGSGIKRVIIFIYCVMIYLGRVAPSILNLT